MFYANELVKTDQEIIEKYNKKLIDNLNKRGWAIYSTESADFSFLSEEDIQICVEKGSEKAKLNPGILYSLLPYIENDSNWGEVKKAMEECVNTQRYPFFVDLVMNEETDGDSVDCTSVYLIDSISFDDGCNVFELVVDYDLSSFLGIEQERKGNIELDLMYVDKLLKQLTKRVR
jgi:hypothetical protein